MQLTLFSDYSLRLLLFVGTRETASVAEASKAYNISRNHLVKIANQLARLGWIEASRGRGGGFKLAKPPQEINLGQVVRQTENLELVECFNSKTNTCVLFPGCALKQVLVEATNQFLAVLDKYTLSDMIARPEWLHRAWSKNLDV